ncbi:hypothetical protein C9J85_07040 [Haloferax sp. wsp5]|nr:hypothetical protein C9J85_07040 [Haloferax sp. wsp5]
MRGVSRLRHLRLEDTPFEAREFSLLWLIALATYGVGDIVTTLTILYYERRFDEANALLVASRTFGGGGFLGLELLVIYLSRPGIWGGVLEEDRAALLGPPALLTVLGLA